MRKTTVPLALLLFSTSAPAALFDVVATGTLAGFTDPAGLLPFTQADATQGFTLRFTFDDTTTDQSLDPDTGLYIGAFQNLELRIGGTLIEPWSQQAILVYPYAPGVRDRGFWAVRTFEISPADDNGLVRESSFDLTLATAPGVPGPLTSDALVPPPWPGPWSIAFIRYVVADPGAMPGPPLAEARASIDSIAVTPSVIPLPPALWLLGSALGALASGSVLRRRKPGAGPRPGPTTNVDAI
jgi:hypothetical protein